MGIANLVINAFTKTIAALSPEPNINQGISAPDLQSYFDSSPEELRLKFNALIAALLAKQAAAEIGIDSAYGENVQDVLSYILSQGTGSLPGNDSIITGMLKDGIVTIAKLSFNPATQDELDALQSAISSTITSVSNALTSHNNDTSKHIDIMTTKGDLIVRGASGPARLAKGAAYKNFSMDSTGDMETWLDSIQSLIQATGDIIIGNGANSAVRKEMGSALQYLRVNSGGTDLEYGALPNKYTSGSYAGDNTSKSISVGFTPTLVIIQSGNTTWIAAGGNTMYISNGGSTGTDYAVSIVGGGFSVNTTYANSNASGTTYYYRAFV